MAIEKTQWHGYPHAAAVICDECGATISEGENAERAEERVPEEAILIRCILFTPHGVRHDHRDYCDVDCQLASGNEDEPESQP